MCAPAPARMRLHVCACTYAPTPARLYAPACMRPPVCAYTHPCECLRLYAPLRVLAGIYARLCGYCGSCMSKLAGAYPTFCKCLITRSQLASLMFAGLCTEILPERTSESTESSAMNDHIFSGSENISEAL